MKLITDDRCITETCDCNDEMKSAKVYYVNADTNTHTHTHTHILYIYVYTYIYIYMYIYKIVEIHATYTHASKVKLNIVPKHRRVTCPLEEVHVISGVYVICPQVRRYLYIRPVKLRYDTLLFQFSVYDVAHSFIIS